MIIPDSFIYNIFSLAIIFFGLWGGMSFIFKGVKIKHDCFIRFMAVTLGMVYILTGVIYLLSFVGMEINLGVYIRPALTLILLLPLLIIHEVRT